MSDHAAEWGEPRRTTDRRDEAHSKSDPVPRRAPQQTASGSTNLLTKVLRDGTYHPPDNEHYYQIAAVRSESYRRTLAK